MSNFPKKNWGGSHLQKCMSDLCQKCVERFRRKLAQLHCSTFFTVAMVKTSNFTNTICRLPPKIQHRYISATVSPIVTNFVMVTQLDTYDANHSSKCLLSEIQHGGRRHFDNWKNRHSLSISLSVIHFSEISHVYAVPFS